MAVAPPSDTAATLDEFTARHERLVREVARPRVLAATTIASLMAEDEEQSTADDADVSGTSDDHVWRKGPSGTALGRAVHAVLQTIDLESLTGLDDLAAMQCAAEGLPGSSATEVASKVRRAAGTPVVAEALDSGRFWRELHVGAPIATPNGDSIVIEGFVDLLVEIDGTVVVVDWKTDSARGRTPEEIVARYRPQAAAYALCLERTLSKRVDRCVFVLTGLPESETAQVEVGGDDLAEAKRELLAFVERLAAAGSAGES